MMEVYGWVGGGGREGRRKRATDWLLVSYLAGFLLLSPKRGAALGLKKSRAPKLGEVDPTLWDPMTKAPFEQIAIKKI